MAFSKKASLGGFKFQRKCIWDLNLLSASLDYMLNPRYITGHNLVLRLTCIAQPLFAAELSQVVVVFGDISETPRAQE